MAVQTTFWPAHEVSGTALMLMLTGRFGFTVIVIELEVTGLVMTQFAEEVNTQLITSPFATTTE
jgi:hypothetical protein